MSFVTSRAAGQSALLRQRNRNTDPDRKVISPAPAAGRSMVTLQTRIETLCSSTENVDRTGSKDPHGFDVAAITVGIAGSNLQIPARMAPVSWSEPPPVFRTDRGGSIHIAMKFREIQRLARQHQDLLAPSGPTARLGQVADLGRQGKTAGGNAGRDP